MSSWAIVVAASAALVLVAELATGPFQGVSHRTEYSGFG